MRILNVVRAQQQQPLVEGNTLDIRLDQLEAMAAASEVDLERYLRLLQDGLEPSAQYFGGAQPV